MKLTNIIITVAILLAAQFSNISAQTSPEIEKSKANSKSDSNIIGYIYQADYSKSKIFYPSDLANTVPKAIVVKGDEREATKFDSLLLAKEFSKKHKQANVILFDKRAAKYSLYELIIGENSPVAVELAETPFRKTLNEKPIVPVTYEALKISHDYSLQILPSLVNKRTGLSEVADIVDQEGLSLIKKTNIQLMAGSKGVRLLFDSELEKNNLAEALRIFQWLEEININSNDLDIVKITRKTNFSKLFAASEVLRPFVEAEMEKWKYSEADRTAVRGNIAKVRAEVKVDKTQADSPGVLISSTSSARDQANTGRTNLLNKIEVYSNPVRGLSKEIDALAAELKTNSSTPARVREIYNLIEQSSLKILSARIDSLDVLNLEPDSAEKTDLKNSVEADILVMQTNLKAGTQWRTLKSKTAECVSGDCVNGIGKIVYPDGNLYEGGFVNGKKQGQGTYTFKNGQVYVGQFSDNYRNGKGRFTFSNGNIYEGRFIDDNFIGQGVYTIKSGGSENGKFTVGEIIDLQSEYVETYWGKAEILEIMGDKYKVRSLVYKTIGIVPELKIRPFTEPDKYEIGQKVEVMVRGTWYKGEIIGNEVEYNDHYRIRFEATNNHSDMSESVRFIRPQKSLISAPNG